MKYLAIICLLFSLTGCYAGTRYVNHNLTQSQAEQVGYECKYKAKMYSQGTNTGLMSVYFFAQEYERCLKAYGFQTVNN